MRPLSSFPGPFRWFAPLLCVVACAAALSAQTTTFTGTVYSPKGVPNGVGDANTGGDPIPNILVFAVDPHYLPPVFSQGQVIPVPPQTGCEAQPDLVPASILGSATTDYEGNFTFTTSGAIPNPITIVIQAGKWRRQYKFDSATVTPGQINTLPPLVMPGSQSEGDLPHIAIVTGDVDALECIFRQIGISDSEITSPDDSGSINLYAGQVAPGAYNATDSTPLENTLLSSPAALAKYDVVMFGCQGTAKQPLATPGSPTQDQTNLINFADNGGRIFATHYEYVWLVGDPPFSDAASFQTGSATSGLEATTINTSYAEGETLANWIQYIGASYNNTLGQIQLNYTAPNTTKVNNPPAQPWAALNSNGENMQFTFDTPVGSAGTPTVSVTYTNPTTAFVQGDPSDSITVNVTNNSTTAANSTLQLTLALPAGLTATSMMGVGNTGWACNVSTLSCTRTTSGQSLAAEATDSVLLTFSVAPATTVGQASITADLTGGGLSGTSQCGRVLFNEYHVENISSTKSKVAYPTECSSVAGATPGTTTAQEKFLEFSLYNLSNFVAPSTTDLIIIQGPTAVHLASPAAIYYGTPLSAAQFNAAGYDTKTNAAVPGTFTYTPAVGTLLNAGTQYQTLSVAFTPTDTTDYLSSTGTTMILVNPDPTTTTLSPSTATAPAGQSVTFTATLGDIYYSPVSGSVTFYDGTTPLGTTTASAGVATFSTSKLGIGVHDITACLIASQNFLASCSTVVGQVISVPPTINPTTTIVASDIDPSIVGQSVTFTATVATTGSFIATPTGTVTFYDGPTSIGTGTLTNGFATFSTSTLAAGLHNITATYAGTTTMAVSTSVVLAQQVNTSLASAGTGFIMTVSPSTFSVGVGSSVSVGVTILELNGFNQPVKLSCAGLPAEATCTFATSTIPATGGSTPLTVTVAAPHNCNSTTPYFTAHNETRGLPILAGVMFLLFARRRRALKGLLLAALLCILPAITGCGNCTDLGVKPGSYTFTVIGTATANGPTPVVTVPGETVSGSAVTQTQVMKMSVTI
jgi:hypothetical protein